MQDKTPVVFDWFLYLHAEKPPRRRQHLHPWRQQPPCSPSGPAGGTRLFQCPWSPHTPRPAWTWHCRGDDTWHSLNSTAVHYQNTYSSKTNYSVCILCKKCTKYVAKVGTERVIIHNIFWLTTMWSNETTTVQLLLANFNAYSLVKLRLLSFVFVYWPRFLSVCVCCLIYDYYFFATRFSSDNEV